MPDCAKTRLLASPVRSAASSQMLIAFGTSIPRVFRAVESGGRRIGFRHLPVIEKVFEHRLGSM
jgi:hypothetical protein